jgi:hypothetical protein
MDVESRPVLGSRAKGLISEDSSECVGADNGDECIGICEVDRVSAGSNLAGRWGRGVSYSAPNLLMHGFLMSVATVQ